MKFTCERHILVEALSTCTKAVASKSSNPALEGILIKADGDLLLTGYNLKICMRTSVEAEVQKPGSAVFNAKLFSDIIRSMPEGFVTVAVKDSTSTISCGASIMNISVINPDDYPEIPLILYEHNFSMPQKVLKELIQGTIFSASDSETKPVLTGCLFKFIGNKLEVVALDNFRMAIRRYTFKDETPLPNEMSFNVPATALREVERLIGDTDEHVTLSLAKRNIMFKVDNTTLMTNLIAGEYFNYPVMLGAEPETVVTVKTSDFISSIERTAIIINERLRDRVRLTFDEELVRLTCKSSLGTSYDECTYASFDGNKIEIGFNYVYLLEALRACKQSETIRLEMKTPLSPLIIKPTDDSEDPDEFIYLIVPVRLQPMQ